MSARRFIAGQITRFTFWLDMTAATKLPGYINWLAAAIDRFVDAHVWNVDDILRRHLAGGDMTAGSFQFATNAERPLPTGAEIELAVMDAVQKIHYPTEGDK